MPTTQVYEPKTKQLKTDDNEPHRVCAYCRVSTDDTDQRNSLVAQKDFFKDIFAYHPNWSNMGVFADEGLSGTSLEKRDQFKRMIEIARCGGVDIIITKEVSRFSRNVQDLLNIVEELRNKGVYIWFLSDDINTESSDYRERLTQIATNAEQESLRTSRRVKWGHQQKMRTGVVFGRKEMFGYNIVRDENNRQQFEIIEEEAEIVKQIFEWFAAGDGTHRIARRLEQKGIHTKRYKNGWVPTVILRILRNEKYVGDLAQGKTYTPDPLTHKKKYNRGDYYSYYIKDHHPESAIISRELWDKVQQIMKEREPSDEVKAKHFNRYWTSGKIFCGICGQRYVSYSKPQKNLPYRAWVCFENHQRGRYKELQLETGETRLVGCNGLRVNDRVLQLALHDIITQIIQPQKDEICESIIKEMQEFTKPKDNSKLIAKAEQTLQQKQNEVQKLTEKFVSGVIPEVAYQPLAEKYNNKILDLQEQILKLKKVDTELSTETHRYTTFIEQIEWLVNLKEKELNEALYERITKKIIVYPLNLLEFHLSFMTRPIYMQYSASGKGELYKIEFTILTAEQFAEIVKNAPKNEISTIIIPKDNK